VSARRYYVFYVPEGREPAVFGGKSGWQYPKSYWGPFATRTEAAYEREREAGKYGFTGKQVARRMRIKHLTAVEFRRVWPPNEERPDGDIEHAITEKRERRGNVARKLVGVGAIAAGVFALSRALRR
jgi:hypothetical protein